MKWLNGKKLKKIVIINKKLSIYIFLTKLWSQTYASLFFYYFILGGLWVYHCMCWGWDQFWIRIKFDLSNSNSNLLNAFLFCLLDTTYGRVSTVYGHMSSRTTKTTPDFIAILILFKNSNLLMIDGHVYAYKLVCFPLKTLINSI